MYYRFLKGLTGTVVILLVTCTLALAEDAKTESSGTMPSGTEWWLYAPLLSALWPQVHTRGTTASPGSRTTSLVSISKGHALTLCLPNNGVS